jgi:hypothetical protein
VLTNLGPVLGTLPAVGIGNPTDGVDTGTVGAAYVTFGTATSGPLANRIVITMSGSAGEIGGVLAGGGISGRDGAHSLIGDGTADVVIGAETGTPVAILDGAKLAAKTSPIDAVGAAEVKINLPAGWSNGEASVSLVNDSNGDGVPDLCLGNAFGAIPGAVAIYW